MRLAVEMAIMNMDGEISAVAVGEDHYIEYESQPEWHFF